MITWLNKKHTPDLGYLQWVLPLFLAATAIIFELVEHVSKDELMDAGFIGEMIIFGFMGPIIIALVLAWMRQLMDGERQATTDLQRMNRTFEHIIEERTAALEQRNAELGRANQELKRLDEMKSEFVSLVSHELRAPLTVLNGGLELALQNANSLSPGTRHTFETMTTESARLTKLVQTILDVSRLEAGKLTINPGPVAVRPLIEQAAEVILVPHNRPIEWKFSLDLPPAWMDETHMEEIVRNLLRNAEKYSPTGTAFIISAVQEGEFVRISVRDHGIGVRPDFQEYIFERFGRGQISENAPPGWGLGLYFARKLIESQNGSIGVISPVWDDPDAPGSEFYLLVPIASNKEE